MKYSKLRFSTLLPFVFVALTTGCKREVETTSCPDGWAFDAFATADCRPSSNVVAGAKSAIGTGVLGVVIGVTGTCGLCDERCTCATTFLSGREVFAYRRADAAQGRACGGPEGELVVGRATTDVNGAYALHLEPGDFTLFVCDDLQVPVGNSVFVEVTVTAGDPAPASFKLDHGIY